MMVLPFVPSSGDVSRICLSDGNKEAWSLNRLIPPSLSEPVVDAGPRQLTNEVAHVVAPYSRRHRPANRILFILKFGDCQ